MMDWNIQSRAHGCQSCGRAFSDKQPYFTLLFDKRHCLERLDVCTDCWTAQYSQGATERKGFLSFWQGVFTVPPPPPPEPIQKESAESLLRKLIEVNEDRLKAAGFILAVMLERKKVLKVQAQTIQAGERTLVYEHAKTGEVFTIVDPRLQLDQLEGVQREVAQLLEKGLAAVLDAAPMVGGHSLDPTEPPALGADGSGGEVTEPEETVPNAANGLAAPADSRQTSAPVTES